MKLLTLNKGAEDSRAYNEDRANDKEYAAGKSDHSLFNAQ
jgi:hypothetical protein